MTSIVGEKPYFLFGDGLPFGHEVVAALEADDSSSAEQAWKLSSTVQNFRTVLQAFVQQDEPGSEGIRENIENNFANDHAGMDEGTMPEAFRGTVLR